METKILTSKKDLFYGIKVNLTLASLLLIVVSLFAIQACGLEEMKEMSLFVGLGIGWLVVIFFKNQFKNKKTLFQQLLKTTVVDLVIVIFLFFKNGINNEYRILVVLFVVCLWTGSTIASIFLFYENKSLVKKEEILPAN